MPLNRKYQKIFGKNAVGTDLGVVGSKSNSNPQYSTDVEVLQSLANWETGLRAMIANNAPYLQDQNSIFYVITSQLAYLFQAGIAEWNSQTEYFSGKSVVLRSGKIYIAIADSTNIEPEVTAGWTTYWKNALNWGSFGGNIYNQTDLWNILLKGMSFDNAISTAISGYPKGTVLKFSQGLNHYDIKAMKNSPNEPVEDILGNTGNIYFARKIEQMYRIVATQGDLPTPSADTYGKFCFVSSENSFYVGGTDAGGNYNWGSLGNNLYALVGADVFTYDNITFYKQNSSYQWVDLGLSYDWLYFSQRAIIKEDKVSGDTRYYRLWSNGWIEQYGTKVFNDTQFSENFDVAFAIEMEDTNYDEHYTCERESKSGAVNFGGGVRLKTTTGMNIQILRVGSDDRCKSVSWKIAGFKALA